MNFLKITDYISEMENEKNQLKKLYKYFDQDSDDVLLIGIKNKK